MMGWSFTWQKNCYFRNWKNWIHLHWAMYFRIWRDKTEFTYWPALILCKNFGESCVFACNLSVEGSISVQAWSYHELLFFITTPERWKSVVNFRYSNVWIHYVMVVLCKQCINLTSKACLVIWRKHWLNSLIQIQTIVLLYICIK